MARTELSTDTVTNSTIIPRIKCCFGYEAVNVGTTIARVNGRRVLPAPAAGLSGERISFTDPQRVELTENFQVEFDPGGVPGLELTQSIHIDT